MNQNRNAPRILVVDDNPANVKILKIMLTASGYDVITSTNGVDALEQSRKELPNIILLDVMMPEMDGYEVCARLKANPFTNNIPVIFITASNDRHAPARGFSAGAVDFVTKPYNEEELLARVRTHLSLQQMRQSVETANRELKQLSDDKTQILNVTANALKGPIQNVLLLIEHMQEDPDTLRNQGPHYLDMMHRSVSHIIDSLNQLLDFDAIESGERPVKLDLCNLANIAQSVMESFMEQATEKEQALAFTAKGENTNFTSDQRFLVQIVKNLISNAIKYSPRNSTILVETDSNENEVMVSVTDQGPGIPEDERENLFKKFKTLKARSTAGESQIGLGLSMVKRIVSVLGGEIKVENMEQGGARFTVILPRRIEIFE